MALQDELILKNLLKHKINIVYCSYKTCCFNLYFLNIQYNNHNKYESKITK